MLHDIAHMRLCDGWVELETLLGEEKVIPGKVVEVDFTVSRILLDENRESDKTSLGS
jgi:predicted RNA-binding protein